MHLPGTVVGGRETPAKACSTAVPACLPRPPNAPALKITAKLKHNRPGIRVINGNKYGASFPLFVVRFLQDSGLICVLSRI